MSTRLNDSGSDTVGAVQALIRSEHRVLNARALLEGQGQRAAGPLRVIRASAVTGLDTDTSLGDSINGGELLAPVRNHEIVSRLVGTHRVPFDVRLNVVSAGASASFVAEGVAVPLTRQTVANPQTMRRKKVVGISVTTEELAKLTEGERELGRDMVGALVEASDTTFIDPANGGSDAKPAAVTYGAPSFVASGATAANFDSGLSLLHNSLVDNGSTLEFAHYVMHPRTLSALALLRDSGGGVAYPTLNVRSGGFLAGIPVIPSASVPHGGSPTNNLIVLIDASRIWVADDNEVLLSTSRVTILEMSDAPTQNITTPTAASQTSMFQTSSVAIRAVRWINWATASAGAVAVLSGVAF